MQRLMAIYARIQKFEDLQKDVPTHQQIYKVPFNKEFIKAYAGRPLRGAYQELAARICSILQKLTHEYLIDWDNLKDSAIIKTKYPYLCTLWYEIQADMDDI